jgi:hypothetical protein
MNVVTLGVGIHRRSSLDIQGLDNATGRPAPRQPNACRARRSSSLAAARISRQPPRYRATTSCYTVPATTRYPCNPGGELTSLPELEIAPV